MGAVGLLPAARSQNRKKEFQELRRILEEAEDDIAKAMGGNKAAGTRVRKSMQDLKTVAQDVRKKILEGRTAQDAPSP